MSDANANYVAEGVAGCGGRCVGVICSNRCCVEVTGGERFPHAEDISGAVSACNLSQDNVHTEVT